MNNSIYQSEDKCCLCAVLNGEGKPIHFQIIGNDAASFDAFCRDETANALLKCSIGILSYQIFRIEFKEETSIPEMNVGDKTRYLNRLNQIYQNGNSIENIEKFPLSPLVLNMVQQTPHNVLESYNIPVERFEDIENLLDQDFLDESFFEKVLEYNGYMSYILNETSRGNYLFTTPHDADLFFEFLQRNFFDPNLDIDQVRSSTVWIHDSYPLMDKTKINLFSDTESNQWPDSNLDSSAYYIRNNAATYFLEPTPENYYGNFLEGNFWHVKNYKSNEIAFLLFMEKYGNAPQECLNQLFCSPLLKEYNDFFSEIRYNRDAKQHTNEEWIKSYATQIIVDKGYEIRGREVTPSQQQIEPKDISDDFFYPKFRGGKHI